MNDPDAYDIVIYTYTSLGAMNTMIDLSNYNASRIGIGLANMYGLFNVTFVCSHTNTMLNSNDHDIKYHRDDKLLINFWCRYIIWYNSNGWSQASAVIPLKQYIILDDSCLNNSNITIDYDDEYCNIMNNTSNIDNTTLLIINKISNLMNIYENIIVNENNNVNNININISITVDIGYPLYAKDSITNTNLFGFIHCR